MRRYYELLDISEDATPEQIEKAYKRAASKHHPDKNPGNEDSASLAFQEAKEAYDCLIDPERRVIYDEGGDASVKTGNPAEDLFVHILNEILDDYESTTDLLDKVAKTINQMIDECSDLVINHSSRVLILNRMQSNLKYQGKGANFIHGVIDDKIKWTNNEIKTIGDAKSAAVELKKLLKDYKGTDAPSRNRPDDTKQQLASFTELFGTTGSRRGGMPFSGV